MTRKHFKAVADAIRNMPDRSARENMAEQMAMRLSAVCPNFNYSRFKAACLAD